MVLHKRSRLIPLVKKQKLFEYITIHHYSQTASSCSNDLKLTLTMTNSTGHHYQGNNIEFVDVSFV